LLVCTRAKKKSVRRFASDAHGGRGKTQKKRGRHGEKQTRKKMRRKNYYTLEKAIPHERNIKQQNRIGYHHLSE